MVDVYVRIRSANRARALAQFLDKYVDVQNSGDSRLEIIRRVFVDERPAPGDNGILAELKRDPDSSSAFSIYLRAQLHSQAIVTVTDHGDLILGLSIDCPSDSPYATQSAEDLLADLITEFQAVGGIAGAELAPPQSHSEWVLAQSETRLEGHY